MSPVGPARPVREGDVGMDERRVVPQRDVARELHSVERLLQGDLPVFVRPLIIVREARLPHRP